MREADDVPTKRAATLLAAACAALLAHHPIPPSQTPGITRIDLKDYGWQKPPPVVEPGWSRPPIAIDHAGRVLAGFTTSGAPKLATRGHPSFTYRILRFSPDGKLDLTLGVPTNNWHDSGLYLDSRGDIVALAGDELQVLAAARTSDLPPSRWRLLAPCGPNCRVAQSPSRRTLAVATRLRSTMVTVDGHTSESWAMAVMLLDSSTAAGLRVRERCEQQDYQIQDWISDSSSFRTRGGGEYDPALRKYAPPRRLVSWPLCDYAERTEVPAAATGAVFPLNGDTVAIAGYDKIAVLSTNGEPKFVLKMLKGDVAENILASSEDGSRFAIIISTWRGVVDWLDIGGHIAARRIAVYDSATGRLVADIPASPKTLPDIAMSPDGHILAILQGHELTIARIP
jgi:hypothetical protein